MQNQHEHLVKEDQQQLEILTAQIDKIQKLKEQYDSQKNQINLLITTINQLKNENESLKSQKNVEITASKFQQQAGDMEEASQDQEQSQRNQKQASKQKPKNSSATGHKGKHQNLTHHVSKDQLEMDQHMFSKTFSNQNGFRSASEEEDPENQRDFVLLKPKTKVWNRSNRSENIQYSNYATGFGKFRHPKANHQSFDQVDNPIPPPPSLRNNSGYLPIPKAHPTSSNSKHQFHRYLYTGIQKQDISQSQQDMIKYDYGRTDISMKTKMINNLISDLQAQLKETQDLLHYQISSHGQTKTVLQKSLDDNAGVLQTVNLIRGELEITAKENQYLKQQVMGLMQDKNRLKWEVDHQAEEIKKLRVVIGEGMIMDGLFEDEMSAMDKIYREFETIRQVKRIH